MTVWTARLALIALIGLATLTALYLGITPVMDAIEQQLVEHTIRYR